MNLMTLRRADFGILVVDLLGFQQRPDGVYNRLIQRIGVFVFPIFVITNFPALFVFGRMNTVYIIWGILAPFLFLGITRIFWSGAVRNYSSASS